MSIGGMELSVDATSDTACMGWAYNPANPAARITVRITSGAGLVAICRADIFREDLLQAGKGTGRYGFRADISGAEFPDGLVSVTATDEDGRAATATVRLPPAKLALAAYLRGQPWREQYQVLMARALRHMPTAVPAAPPGPAARAAGYPSRAVPDKLFAPAPEQVARDGTLITSYLAHECCRERLDDRFDLHGDVIEQLRVLDWYLTTYLHHRKRKLPLSASQIAFLNGPVPLLHHACKISVATANYARRELGPGLDLADPAAAREAVYWWCVERAPALKLQDSLVPDCYGDLLTAAGVQQRWEAFHVNYFVERFHARHPELHFLKLDVEQDRILLAAYLVAACTAEPGLARFLPREAVSHLLGPTEHGSATALLDHVLRLAFETGAGEAGDGEVGDGGAGPPTSAAVIEAIARGGYSLKLGRRLVTSGNGNSAECLDGPGPVTPPEPGIAVIGPLRGTSGLGQAMRLSAAVLALTEPGLALHDFDMDNPASKDFIHHDAADGTPRRTINLLHLNADFIPLAFAHLPQEAYRLSYNIGFFFWELTELPPSHRLALEMLDEIWVASEYNRAIYAAHTDIPVVNVGMAVGPLPELPPIGRAFFGIPEDRFVLLATFDAFSYVERKNPLAVIEAFQLAFPPGPVPGRPPGGQDAMLILKTQNRHKVGDPYQVKVWNRIAHLCERDPRIVVMNDTLPYAELLALKRGVDCYVSLHRSEGWGFGLIEAMQLGVPVIATGYSGNMEFCNPGTALLVGYRLVAARQHEYPCVEPGSVWAEPSVAEAAAHMRAVQADRAGVQAMVGRARTLVETSFSLEATSRRYAARLAEIAARLAEGPASPPRSTPSP